MCAGAAAGDASAAREREEREELADRASEDLCKLVVRNTFLEAVGTSQPAPRSASVPPGARLAGHSPRGKESACSDTASTQAWSDADGSEAEASAGRTSPSGPEGSPQVDLPGVKLVAPSDTPTSGAPPAGGFLVLALEEILAEQGHCQECKPTMRETRLNSRARAWTPQEAVPKVPSTPELMWEVRAVVRAATFALAGAERIIGTDANEGPQGWVIVAHLLPEDYARQRERLLCLAKEALLQGARASQNIYVLGHRWRPFMATPLGFCARLAAVPEPKQACWGLLDKGVCTAGGKCHWEHPTYQTNISVMVKPREQ